MREWFVRPVVHVNTEDPADRWTYDYAHELHEAWLEERSGWDASTAARDMESEL